VDYCWRVAPVVQVGQQPKQILLTFQEFAVDNTVFMSLFASVLPVNKSLVASYSGNLTGITVLVNSSKLLMVLSGAGSRTFTITYNVTGTCFYLANTMRCQPFLLLTLLKETQAADSAVVFYSILVILVPTMALLAGTAFPCCTKAGATYFEICSTDTELQTKSNETGAL
jgi:hypothetical protein